MQAAEVLRSSIFKQILSSVREIGLIEPLVVYPQEGKGFLLLDGHLRFEALKILGTEEVKCILSTDDESYTYNKRVNHIPPVAQHFMLMEALKSGVAEERIAATLNVDVAAIRRRAQMLEGICPEVVEMLRDKKLSLELFPILRKMKAIGQIATVELMVLRNDYTVAFAKTRLAISPPALLDKGFNRTPKQGQCRRRGYAPGRRHGRHHSEPEGNRRDLRNRRSHAHSDMRLSRPPVQ